jgi:signal transduction histidine kinase/FixJ family two-component response regulator
MLWLLGLGGLLAAVAIATAAIARTGELRDPVFWLMMTSFGLMVPVRFGPLRYATRARAFVGLLAILANTSLMSFGYTSGPILCNVMAVLAAGLFLGRGAMLATHLGTTAAIIAVGAAATGGYAPKTATAAEYDLALTGWIRAAASYALAGGAIAALVSYVLRKVEQSERALEESRKLEALGKLAGGIAHDFNNALQIVLVWQSILRRRAPGAPIADGLDAIEGAATQAASLTRQLLAFGRRATRAPRALDLATETATWLDSITRLLPEDIELRRSLRATPAIHADPGEIQQILLNLVLNARDASATGGLIEVVTGAVTRHELPSPTAGPDRWALLSVRDHGCGMTREVRGRMFEPFFTTKGDRGNGLGLSMVYGAMQQNGGQIDVTTEPGCGTCFRLFFPMHTAERPTRAPTPADPRRLDAATALLAEDEPSLRGALVEILRDAGVVVLEAADGNQAIDLIARHDGAIDLLCIDGVMPGAPTKAVIDAYLARQPRGGVLVCSGHVEEELVRRDIGAGRYAFLTKPFTRERLLQRVSELLAAPAPRQEGGATRPLERSVDEQVSDLADQGRH